MPTSKSILALDVGSVRIGVAIASLTARLPQPLCTLQHTEQIWDNIKATCEEQNVVAIVVGLPRNLNGDETAQTTEVRDFINMLKTHIKLPVYLQDEAGTSKQAETELINRGKKFDKGMIDALAATYILDDYLKTHQKELFT